MTNQTRDFDQSDGRVLECPDCDYTTESEIGVKIHRGRKHFDNPEERFWDKVDKGDPEECWEWKGCKNKEGYGEFYVGEQRYKSTHYVLFEIIGEDFEQELVMHTCDNPPCVNPKHLKQGTYKENTQDCLEKGRRTQNAKGEGNGFSKLTEEQVIEIKERLEEGESYDEVKEDFSVSRSHIRNIDNGHFWSHVQV